MDGRMEIAVKGPYDLALSLRAASAFEPDPPRGVGRLRLALRLGERRVRVEARQVSGRPARLEVRWAGGDPGDSGRKELARKVSRVVSAGLDLRPFYRAAAGHPVMGGIVRELRGLKPLRPAEVFDMAIIAVTEQQISLTAAKRVRERFLALFGAEGGGEASFPSPREVARKTVEELKACGLSGRKAEYILGLARAVERGEVDLDALEEMDDGEAREYILSLRGFGPWAADYILVRGLGRADAVPADDLGIRTTVGLYLGDGERLSAGEVREALAPFAPWRGLAAFYLLAHLRLRGPLGGR